MSLVASEKRLESISLHRCDASVVMQTHAWAVQLDYDVSPAAAEFLKLLFRSDVDPDFVTPWSRPDVGLNATGITSWRIGLESCQRDAGVTLYKGHVCRCLAWLAEFGAILRNLLEVVEIDAPKDLFALPIFPLKGPNSDPVAFGSGDADRLTLLSLDLR